MSKLLTIGIFTVILTLMLGSFYTIPVSAQEPDIAIKNVYWGSDSNTLQPAAGDKNVDLSVVVINTDTVTMQKLTAKIELKGTPFTSSTGDTQAWAGYGLDLLPGQSANLQFTLDINENAILGDYKVNMEITTQTVRYSTGVTITSDIIIPLRGKVSFSIETDSDAINPGTNTFTIKLSNTGDTTASSVDVSVATVSPLTIMDDSYWFFKAISPSQIIPINMKIFAPATTVGQSYPVSLSLSYKDAYGSLRSISRSVGVNVNNIVSTGEVSINRVGWTSLDSPMGGSPGDEGTTLLVEIQNLSNNTVTGLNAYLKLTHPFTNITGGNTALAYSSLVNPSQTVTLQFKLDISPEADLKDYPIDMTLSYFIVNSLVTPNEYIKAQPVELKFMVPLYGKSILDVDVESGELSAGIANTVEINIANIGTARVHNLEATLNLPSSASTLTSSTTTAPLVFESTDNYQHFDSVEPGSSVSLITQILAAKSAVGNYQLSLALSYKDELGINHAETRTLGISVSPIAPSSLINIESYSFKPDPVHQGDTFTINIDFKNIGDFIARTTTVQLLVPTAFTTVSPATVSLGNLSPKSGTSVDYIVLASPDVESGVIYPFTVNIQYTDSLGVRQVAQNNIGIPIHGTIELIAYDVNIIPSTVPTGKEFTITLTILNKGTITAKYTEVSLEAEAPLDATENAISYIGDVDPNAPFPISLKAAVNPNAEEGSYPLKVKISYQDEYRKPQLFLMDIPVDVTANATSTLPQDTSPSPQVLYGMGLMFNLIIIIVVAVLVIAAIVVFKRRRSSQTALSENRH